ncbi:MAG TPA: dihydrofolate reductase family protein [Streptosporangiaceae bacterium]|nr:dihydrofolate reductase family protein [Streptosporangiaceae bacterium]
MDLPYVLLSCAMSVDGYIDDASDVRLMLSGPGDYDLVDELRAGCDAVLVGAGTVRTDNPRLLLRSQARRQARIARGTTPDPLRVVLTTSGDLDPLAAIFTSADAAAVVYAASPATTDLAERLGVLADVVDAGDPLDLTTVLADLAGRGVGRLMVEGGSVVHTSFLTAGLADELRLTIAPFFVGDSAAPRLVRDGTFPWRPGAPAELADVRQIGNDVVLTYALSDRFTRQSRQR